MERKTGTIEDVVVIAKQRSTNPDEQARLVQIGMDLIKRNNPNEVKSLLYSKNGYDYHIEGFADAGGAYFWFNIYRGTVKAASVLEVYRIETEEYEVLFASSKDFLGPITPTLKE